MHEKLSDNLKKILISLEGNDLTVQDLIHKLGLKSDLLLSLFISTAFSFPLTIPGLSFPFGLILALIGLCFCLNREVWLPKWLLNKKIHFKLIEKTFLKGIWLFNKIEWIIHPRLDFFASNTYTKRLNGILILILGLFLALPIPIPFTNVIAAFPILLLSLGTLEEDGLFIMLGYIGFAFSISAFISIAYALFYYL